MMDGRNGEWAVAFHGIRYEVVPALSCIIKNGLLIGKA